MPPTAIRMTTVVAPWGPIHIAVSERGLVALDNLTSDDDFEAGLRNRFRSEVEPGSSRLLDKAVSELDDYLRGERTSFTLPIDLADRPDWDRRVLAAVAQVPWGTTASYGQLARLVDRPGAARAAGGAVSRSPIGIVVPCHRVIAADGTLGGYGGASWDGSVERFLDLKHELLAMEGLAIPRRRE